MKTSGESENRLVCLVCCKQFSCYTCPRCNVRYCSLPCYRSHSERCLESFNRDNVLANMQDCVATPDTRRRMLQALHRFHAGDENMQDESDDDNIDDIDAAAGVDVDGYGDDGVPRCRFCILSESTLNKLASGQEINLSDLSPEEEKAFTRALTSGEFSHLIEPWEPWWLSPFVKKLALNKDGNRVVRLVDGTDMSGTVANDTSDIPPPLDSPLPPLRQLTSKPPSSLLGVHLAEVLYSYCFTLRFFNGDWICDAYNAALACLSVSHVLGQSASPEILSEALNSCFETICSPFFKAAGGYKFALALLDDVAVLLHVGRPGVICALSDLHRMLDKAAKDAKQGASDPADKKEHQKVDTHRLHKVKVPGRSNMKAVCMKVFFLLCWTNEQPHEVLESMALLIETEKAQNVENHQSNVLTSDKKKESMNSNRKAFIEEINPEP